MMMKHRWDGYISHSTQQKVWEMLFLLNCQSLDAKSVKAVRSSVQPPLKGSDPFQKSDQIGAVESVKAASDIVRTVSSLFAIG